MTRIQVQLDHPGRMDRLVPPDPIQGMKALQDPQVQLETRNQARSGQPALKAYKD